MSGFRLFFESVEYVDSHTLKSFSAAVAKTMALHATGDELDRIIATLRVEEVPGGTTYVWDPCEIKFKTTRGVQELFIILLTSARHNNLPRFHLHGAKSAAPDWLTNIQHKPGGDFEDLPKFSAFPPGTDMIKVVFGMPGAPPKSGPFKFDVIAWDNAASKDVPCDPQVGNGPP